MNETKPNEGLTSAEIKKQIAEATKDQAAQQELKNSGLPLTGQIANEINASGPSTPDRRSETESKPEPHGAAEQKTTDSKETVDFKEWAKKKGINWTTETSVLEALHKSDQAFHRMRSEEKAREQVSHPPYTPPAPSYQPPAYQPQPSFNAPQQIPRDVVENIARTYNMSPEDVPKLAAFNRDFFEAAMKGERERQQREFDAIKRENQKNSVFRELSSDPAFRDPEVAMEFHNVLETMQARDPQSFEQDPSAYHRAYDQTLINIARRNLEGRRLQEGVSPGSRSMTPPSVPPRPLGNGSAGGATENENGIDAKAFAALSVDEKRAVLDRMGLRPAY